MWQEKLLEYMSIFFTVYLIGYSTYLFLSVIVGGIYLDKKSTMNKIHNELKHDYYFPISIIVPAYNEEVTIIESINSLINLDYKIYEIVIVNDGSKDDTVKVLIDHFKLKEIKRPIHLRLKCKPIKSIYEGTTNRPGVTITLIDKENGGKGDALNMGICASKYPYFLGLDADSLLQKNTLEKIIQPVLENNKVIAVGGLVRVAQCVEVKDGEIVNYSFPSNPIVAMQVMEYERSFLASRIMNDYFNGNLIISGAVGLFKKDAVISVGGYETDTLGEDMELVVKLHTFCRNNKIPYEIRYEPNAICWSQAPGSLKDLFTQRRRWHLGLFQSLLKYRRIFLNINFGLIGFLSYIYYLVYEFLSPFIEIVGIFTIIFAAWYGDLNIRYMIYFYLLYTAFGAILTITAFFQRIYTQHITLNKRDIVKAIFTCMIEAVFFHFLLSFIRITSFKGYRKRKLSWGSIKREKYNQKD